MIFKNKLNCFGKLPEIIDQKSVSIKKKDLTNGVNNFDDLIIFKEKNNIKVYNRVCDHLGGKLISKEKEYICPVHNWKFDPKTGQYFNKHKKKQLLFEETNDFYNIFLEDQTPKIQKSFNFDDQVSIRFFNHAFLIVSNKNFSFATDPWALGPSFVNGWWLENKTKNDWLKKLNECDFIYISHNHPDHLNEYTLSYINKDKPIIVGNFKDQSTEIKLINLGFKNIIPLDFNYVYNLKNSDLNFTILKSGDFKNDSGIYFSVGDTSCLFDVDANSINYLNLPKVDIYASSYGSAAGGYPLIFENYSTEQKKKIIEAANNFYIMRKVKNIKKSKANFFIPYASSQIPKLKKDEYIKKNVAKINIDRYKKILNDKCLILDLNKTDLLNFCNGKLIRKKKIIEKKFNSLDDKTIVRDFNQRYSSINIEEIKNYFYDSNFKDELKLFLSLTDYSFKKNFLNLSVDFSGSKIKIVILKEKQFKINNHLKNEKKLNIIYIKARKEALNYIVKSKSSWEDIGIGYQIRVYRYPDQFNHNFVEHFQYKYLAPENKKTSGSCSVCPSLMNLVDRELIKKNVNVATE